MPNQTAAIHKGSYFKMGRYEFHVRDLQIKQPELPPHQTDPNDPLNQQPGLRNTITTALAESCARTSAAADDDPNNDENKYNLSDFIHSPNSDPHLEINVSGQHGSNEAVPVCRICLEHTDTTTHPLVAPCDCNGSMKLVHLFCLRQWMEGRLNIPKNVRDATVNRTRSAAFFYNQLSCELCKSPYPQKIDIPNMGSVELLPLPRPSPPYIMLEAANGQQRTAFYQRQQIHQDSLREEIIAATTKKNNSVDNEAAKSPVSVSSPLSVLSPDDALVSPRQVDSPQGGGAEGLTSDLGEPMALHIIALGDDVSAGFGRSTDNEVRVNDISVSRIHAAIKTSNGAVGQLDSDVSSKASVCLIDSFSKFGTGVLAPPIIRVEATPLFFQCGRSIFWFHLDVEDNKEGDRKGTANRGNNSSTKGGLLRSFFSGGCCQIFASKDDSNNNLNRPLPITSAIAAETTNEPSPAAVNPTTTAASPRSNAELDYNAASGSSKTVEEDSAFVALVRELPQSWPDELRKPTAGATSGGGGVGRGGNTNRTGGNTSRVRRD